MSRPNPFVRRHPSNKLRRIAREIEQATCGKMEWWHTVHTAGDPKSKGHIWFLVLPVVVGDELGDDLDGEPTGASFSLDDRFDLKQQVRQHLQSRGCLLVEMSFSI